MSDWTPDEQQRYSRPNCIPAWREARAQEKLRAARVLVVGAGGLGSPVIAQLAGAGVGELWIAEHDTVSLSNLHRQTLYSADDVGQPKAERAAAWATRVNPHIRAEVVGTFDPNSATDLIRQTTLVLDCTDNFPTRYAIADACMSLGREWVWGAVGRSSGLVSVLGPAFGLRDLFPDSTHAPNPAEDGVLGPVAGLVGNLMALEALKVLGGMGEPLRGRLWSFDAMSGQTRVIRLRKGG